MGAPLRRVQGPVKHLSWGVECEPTSYELQANELLVASQAVASCEPTSCQLQVVGQGVASLPHYDLQVSNQQASELQTYEQTSYKYAS